MTALKDFIPKRLLKCANCDNITYVDAYLITRLCDPCWNMTDRHTVDSISLIKQDGSS